MPLIPDQSGDCIVALRNPPGGLRYGFRPRTLLFGAVAAVLRYNCFSRISAVLACRILDIPTVTYFEDIGSMSKSSISDDALGTFAEFCRILMVLLKKEKSGLWCQLPFLGLVGDLPAPDNDMTLSVALTDEEKSLWAARIEEFLKVGRIIRNELESLTGRLSFSHTAVFGRFGRGGDAPPLPEGERGLL